MKYSKQRETILNLVIQHPVHPTVDWVYHQVRREIPNISMGTVYRNLNQLAEHGLLRKMEMPEGGCRFDGRLDPHEHLLCSQCGTVFDLALNAFALLEQMAGRKGFLLEGYDLVLRGVCPACRKESAADT